MKISTVYLSLGGNCNFSCRYCMQHFGITKNIETNNDFSKIKQFLLETKPKKIVLWGGEPLLYWNKITNIVPFIREQLGRDVTINTITNGSLLTQDKVDFINEYNIGVGLSNDAFATKETRYTDVLQNEKIFNLYKQIKSKGINIVLSAKTQDLYKVWAYYDELFGEFVNVGYDVLKNFSNDHELGNFDYAEFQKTLDKMKDGFVKSVLEENFESREYLFFERYVTMLNFALQNNTENKLKCGVFETALNVDFDGNLYLCKNSDSIVGNVNDVNKAKLDFEKYKNVPSFCSGCKYMNVCDTCLCVLENEELKRESCKVNKMIYHSFYNGLEELLNMQRLKE